MLNSFFFFKWKWKRKMWKIATPTTATQEHIFIKIGEKFFVGAKVKNVDFIIDSKHLYSLFFFFFSPIYLFVCLLESCAGDRPIIFLIFVQGVCASSLYISFILVARSHIIFLLPAFFFSRSLSLLHTFGRSLYKIRVGEYKICSYFLF